MNDTELILQAIRHLRSEMNERFEAISGEMDTRFEAADNRMNARFEAFGSEMNARFEAVGSEIRTIQDDISEIKAQLAEVDTSIGMLAEWADSVSVITKVPFAAGGSQVG